MIMQALLRVAGIAMLFVVTLAAASRPEAAWTQFRVDGSHEVAIDRPVTAKWTAVTGGPISDSPIVVGTTLYVGNNHGYVDAIDVGSGRILWSRHLSNAVMSQPLYYNGMLIVGLGDEQSYGSAPSTVYVGRGPSGLAALDPATGTTRWETNVAGSAMPTGAIIDGMLIEHNGAGWITAIDPANGKIVYARNLHSIASMTAILPTTDGNFVTIGVLSNSVFKLRTKDAATIWQTNFSEQGSGHGDCPPASDGHLMVCTYVMPVPPATYTLPGTPAVERAYALNLTNGEKVWDVALQRGVLPQRNEAAIPLLVGGVAYFGSAIAPYMHAVDVKTGRVLWQTKVRGPVKGGVVSANEHVYFGDLTGHLWSLDQKTGAVVGSKRMNSGFNVGSPIIVGSTLFIGSKTGSVYALPLRDIDNSHDR